MSQWQELLMRDHEIIEKVFEAVGRGLASSPQPDKKMVGEALRFFVEYADGCHNRKEELHVFPLAEARGIPRHGGPLAVMLMEHDQSKQLLARLRELGQAYLDGRPQADVVALRKAFIEYSELLKGHYWKENDILYPMVARMTSQADADAVTRGIEEVEAALGVDTRALYYRLADQLMHWGELKDLAYNLPTDVMAAVLNSLPMELSFVDADDTVRYFSHENQTKIFPRSRGSIGAKVQTCHPQKSVHMVNRIIAEFRAGERAVGEFWIDMQGKKIHIRYLPVRAPDGAYLGCLETVQDVTAIQKLSGQHRLLDEE